MTDKVAAVVVTYNRVDKLGRVLDSILAQTRGVDQLIVIDNASTDSTPQLLAVYQDDPRVEVVRLETNTGGAGGFAAGMERAYARGADWVWIMDDDCYTGKRLSKSSWPATPGPRPSWDGRFPTVAHWCATPTARFAR